MEKIASFQVDHTKLEKGLYVSRIDSLNGAVATTFDIRMKKPNQGDYLSTASLHTIEHIGATYFRNLKEFKDSIIYFGPMGCRTGFYLVLFGERSPSEIAPAVAGMFSFIASFEGDIPGASEIECGNWKDQDLKGAKQEAKAYLGVLWALAEKAERSD
ncbi:MAG: S-ribosylhomocysteine lyase [Eubacteriaceae bacterium]|jgi:S-ribosylhomocysteine lyase|nr:S-ribosylhomocysteine lyase [Eubacteriaceae bacterium]